MKREQLSNRIGNIEDRLVEQAENAPNFGRQQRNRNIRRMVSMAAVLVLMVGSFTIGAIAMAKETIVYVEKEQEIIKVGDSGITLILPETWKEKYGVEQYGNEVIVYHLATRESFDDGTYGGDLFRIFCIEERFPMDYVFPYPGFTIAITETHTYVFNYPSDVQFDRNNPAAMTEYMELSDDIKNIEIVMNAQMLENTMNATNWVEGTVFVDFLENWVTIKTVVCDEEQSRIIREIIKSQDYSLERGSFFADLWFMFNGEEYLLNLTTGMIQSAGGENSAVLSAEDLNRIIEVLND